MRFSRQGLFCLSNPGVLRLQGVTGELQFGRELRRIRFLRLIDGALWGLHRRFLLDRFIEKIGNLSVRVLRQPLDQFVAATNFMQLAGRNSGREQALELKFDFRVGEAAISNPFRTFLKVAAENELRESRKSACLATVTHAIFYSAAESKARPELLRIYSNDCIFFKQARIDLTLHFSARNRRGILVH